MELPSNYLEEMKELLGDQYEAYLASFEQKTRQGLRVNTAKIAPETFRQKADISLECVPWCENGFAFDEKQTVTKHPYYYAGLYYVQEPLPRHDRYKMYDLQTSIVLGYRGFILYLWAVYNPTSNKEVHHSWQKLN